ncbi:hypothetical protein BEWA_027800 [Theileria equi strain WA]|uniref:Signal peptide-containing protein n=1 Tax=Theileria equi strain WA TaxID=1537102 RepID=L0AY57_THEEQ|nr:hypothetical protein BEWA_027800 [Theileria equi strain WA]AFZ79931.1 hypothetical protein BEWA_027800 [Theileria equi strain WA]|eukprot:XP_004829597.1 hypothetical protein BEWA_027800 [Theileria equi strain WA]
MTGVPFDVLAPFDHEHFDAVNGTDEIYTFVTVTAKSGFHVSKVTHGVHVLWEEGGEPLKSLTLHKLGDLPVALLLDLSGIVLYFLFVDLAWKKVSREEYENKIHIH